MHKRVTSEANLDTARAKRDTAQAAVKRIEAVIAQKAIDGAVRRPPRHPQGGEGPVRLGRHGAGLAAGARSDPRRLPDARADDRQAARWASRSSSPSTPIPARSSRARSSRSMRAWPRTPARCWCAACLPNPERKLLPGMFANVTVLVGEPRDVVTVPRTAVTYSLYGDSVYVVKPAPAEDAARRSGGRGRGTGQPAEPQLVAERRFVKTGQVRDDRVAITSGLEAGEEVVTTGQLKLNPGASHPHRQHPAAEAGRKSGRSSSGADRHVVHRHLHSPPGARHRGEPADPADRARLGVQPAGAAVSRASPTRRSPSPPPIPAPTPT